jgi:hypothetical protein
MTKEKKGISKKEFDNFTKEMWKRLKEGEKKYGTEYKVGDLQKSILEEGTDLANYSFMMYLKTKQYNKKIKNQNI